MKKKNFPLLLMLTAGFITALMTMVWEYPLKTKLAALLLVLLVFYLLGSIVVWLLDYFDKQNKAKEEEAAALKEQEQSQEARTQEQAQETKTQQGQTAKEQGGDQNG